MAKLDVILYPRETLVWPFSGEHPYYRLVGGDRRVEQVDPFPAYAHDRHLTYEHLQYVAKLAPVNMDVVLHLLSSEVVGRTNGFAHHGKYYAKPGDADYYGTIILSAKRIPPMQSMTKYLVAHEYGHLVEGWLDRNQKEDDTRKMYADLRGLKYSDNYGGGIWHRSIGELFANDFRILVCRTEVGYWPHEDIARPETLVDVQNFWKATATQLVADHLLVSQGPHENISRDTAA